MASYAAVISLEQTILQFGQKCPSIDFYNSTREALNYAKNVVDSLKVVLRRQGSSGGTSVVDGEIRDAAHQLQDELESFFSYQLLLGKNIGPQIYFRIEDLYGLRKKYMVELRKSTLTKKVNVAADADFGGNKSEVVGFSVEYEMLKSHILDGERRGCKVISLVGMGGTGKTTLAKRIFEDAKYSDFFGCVAWVTVGQKGRLQEVMQCILDQLPQSEGEKMPTEKKVELQLKLRCKRFLIVLDDLWNSDLCFYLVKLLSQTRISRRFLITTRLEDVSKNVFKSKFSTHYKYYPIQMSLMDKEESWCLFCHKVFGDKLFPPQLEKAGKEIVNKCDGLPLTIVTVAALLSKAEMTEEYWNEVANKREHSVFVEAYDQISKVLISSYNYLPLQLKPFFLYFGAFPQKYEIPTSKLRNFWIAEGFGSAKEIEDGAVIYLRDLVCHNILMVHQRTSYDRMIKTSRLHSAIWQLCIRVARDNKFLYVIRSYDDGLAESIKGQRRLCVHNNILFSIKEVHGSMASISTARSLLCTGKYHQYPVPLCSNLSLLRILKALTIRFYEFPEEVLNIVSLRYLALTYNGKVPASISKLRNLRFLIVHQHLSIKSSEDSSYLPMEVWDMIELEYLHIMGRDLPDPNGTNKLCGVKALLDVSHRSCTKEVLGEFKFTLHKLGIRIEKGHVAAEILSCFDNLSELRHLKSLKCVIMDPILTPEVVTPPPALLSQLPLSLKKLSLSGFGYEWENASKIASSLPKLEVLKLQSYAFRGPTWITREGEFPRLKYLLIEDTDLVDWRSTIDCFPNLRCLIIRHCYKLEGFPRMSLYSYFHIIEVVDCNPLAEICAKKQGEEIKDRIESSDTGLYFYANNLTLEVKEIVSD